MQFLLKNLKYLILGALFGFVLMKAEVVSWYRIQEMFRMQSFHMYGVIGSAIVVGILSLQIIKRFNVKAFDGTPIKIAPKEWRKGQIYGGFIFGVGWAFTGACPGPLYAQIGSGHLIVLVTLFFAILGTWTYGRFSRRIPNHFKSRKPKGSKVAMTHPAKA